MLHVVIRSHMAHYSLALNHTLWHILHTIVSCHTAFYIMFKQVSAAADRPRDAVSQAHHVVHRCRRSVWQTGDRDHHQSTTLAFQLS